MKNKKHFQFVSSEFDAIIPEFNNVIESLMSKYDFFTRRGPGRSMRNIDLSLAYWFLKKYQPDGFFESGIWWGRCSYIVAESMKQLKIDIPYYLAATYNKHPRIELLKKDYPNVRVLYTTGQNAVNHIRGYNKMGMLIDGPKWRHKKDMYALYRRMMRHNTIAFSIHDDTTKKEHPRDYRQLREYYLKTKNYFTLWRPSYNEVGKRSNNLDKNRENLSVAALINRSLL